MAKRLRMGTFAAAMPGFGGAVVTIADDDDCRIGISAVVAPHTQYGFVWLSIAAGNAGWRYMFPLSRAAAEHELAKARRATKLGGFGGERWMPVPMLAARVSPFGREIASLAPGASAVYFVQQGNGGPIKVGTTNDLQRRLAQLQTASPSDLVLIAVAPGGAELEASIHARCAEFRLRGEWFRAEDALLDAIAEVTRVAY